MVASSEAIPAQAARIGVDRALPERPSLGAEAEADLAVLIAASREGDREALQVLYGRYRPLLAGVVAGLRRRLPVGVDADDLSQEAAEQFVDLVRSYDPSRGTNLTTYLQRKLKWRVANFLRAEARRAGHLPLDAAPLDRLADEAAASPSDPPSNPRLARALRQLSPRQRAVIAGLYWQDRSTREVAATLGISSQAVTALRRRAEGLIRRELSEGVSST